MYSRYSNISIPKNYSGSRFPINEPETKTHKGELRGAVRTTHSPTFVEMTAKQQSELQPKSEGGDINTHNFEYEEPDEAQMGEECVCNDCKECDHCCIDCDCITDNEDFSCEESNSIQSPSACEEKDDKKPFFDFSSVKNIISNFDADTLIILGLIILLMSDSDKSNDDVVAILALLLLN